MPEPGSNSPAGATKPSAWLRVRAEFRRYRRITGWYMSQLIRSYPRRLTVIAAASVLGTTAQAGVLGFLLLYSRQLEEAATFDLMGVTMAARDTGVFLAVVAAATVGLLVAAGLLYVGERTTVRTAADFSKDAAAGLLSSFGGLSPNGPKGGPVGSRKQVASYLRKTLTNFGVATRTALRVIHPAMTAFYALCFLLYIRWDFTLALLLAAPLFAVPYYIVNRQVVSNERALTEARQRASKEPERLMSEFEAVPVWSQRASSLAVQRFRGSALAAIADNIAGRLTAIAQANAVSNLGIATGMAVCLGYLGTLALNDEIRWSSFLAYIVALRTGMTNLRATIKSVTTFARFYPKISDHVLILHGRSDGRDQFRATPERMVLTPDEHHTLGSLHRATLAPGAPGAVLGDRPLNRYNVIAVGHAMGIAARLNGNRVLADSFLISQRPTPLTDLTLAETVARVRAQVSGDTEVRVERFLQTPEVSDLVASSQDAASTFRTADGPQNRDLVVTLLECWLSTRSLVIVEAAFLRALAPDTRARALDLFSDRKLIVHDAQPSDQLCAFGEAWLALADTLSGVLVEVFGGETARDEPSRVHGRFAELSGRTARYTTADDLDDEDED